MAATVLCGERKIKATRTATPDIPASTYRVGGAEPWDGEIRPLGQIKSRRSNDLTALSRRPTA
jgi:hypothetical protein